MEKEIEFTTKGFYQEIEKTEEFKILVNEINENSIKAVNQRGYIVVNKAKVYNPDLAYLFIHGNNITEEGRTLSTEYRNAYVKGFKKGAKQFEKEFGIRVPKEFVKPIMTEYLKEWKLSLTERPLLLSNHAFEKIGFNCGKVSSFDDRITEYPFLNIESTDNNYPSQIFSCLNAYKLFLSRIEAMTRDEKDSAFIYQQMKVDHLIHEFVPHEYYINYITKNNFAELKENLKQLQSLYKTNRGNRMAEYLKDYERFKPYKLSQY